MGGPLGEMGVRTTISPLLSNGLLGPSESRL